MPPAKKDQKKKKRDNESSDPPRKKRKPNPKKKSKPKKVVNNLPIYSPAKAIVLILGDKIQVGTDSQDLPLTIPCVMAIRRKKPREKRQKPERTPRGVKLREEKLENLCQTHLIKMPAQSEGGDFFAQAKGEKVYTKENCVTSEKTSICNFVVPDKDSHFLFGKAALNLPPSSIGVEWDLYYPIRNGCLNVSDGLTLRQAKHRLQLLLEHVLTKKMGIQQAQLMHFGVALGIPVHWERGFVVEISSLLLKDIGFGGIFYHHFPVLTTFGYLLTSACVVTIGRDTSNIACIIEGQVVRKSFRFLPYGQDHVVELLDFLLQKNEFHVPEALLNSPMDDLRKRRVLGTIFNQVCGLVPKKEPGKYKHRNADFVWPEEKKKISYSLSVGAASYIPPLAFFDTDLIWDFLEDDSLKAFRDINSAGVFNHFHSRIAKTKVKGADDYENFIKRDEMFSTDKAEDPFVNYDRMSIQRPAPLDRAVCSAIMDTLPKYRPELAQSIVLAGESFSTTGLTKMLQARVSHLLPKLDNSIKKVDVLRPRSASPVTATWKGMAKVCLTIGSRDLWINQDAFLNTIDNHNFIRNVIPFHFHGET